MIAFSLIFLVTSLLCLVAWLSNALPSFTSLAHTLCFISGGIFVILFVIGIFSKPPKVH